MPQAPPILESPRPPSPGGGFRMDLTKKGLGGRDRGGQEHRRWIGTEASKRCRELRAAGLIESEPVGRYERFRAKPPTKWELITDRATGEVLAWGRVYECSVRTKLAATLATTLFLELVS